MHRLILSIFVFVIIGCKQLPEQKDLDLLNGYWEIEKVVFPDGSSKEYRVSTTVDYFFYEQFEGYRKKVQPKLDGGYTTSDDAEYFKIEPKSDIFIIRYENELSQWEEKILKLEEDLLILGNQEGIKYHYKKFQSIAVQ